MKENKKSFTIKQILITLLVVLVVIFLIHVVRNMIIIKSLSNKADKIENINNYHISFITHSDENLTVIDIWFKDGKYLEKVYMSGYDMEQNNPTDNNLAVNYYDGKSDYISTFYRNTNEVIKQNINEDESPKGPVIKLSGMTTVDLYDEDFLTLLRTSILMKISSEKSFDKDCYVMRSKTEHDNVALYVDKETGLTIRNYGASEFNNFVSYSSSDFKYDLNNVTDEDLNFEKVIEK